MFARLVCLSCGKDSPALETYRCPDCGGELDLCYDLTRIRADGSFAQTWRTQGPMAERFASLLPLAEPEAAVTLGEGGTPLVRSRRLAERLGLRDLYFKLEGCNPTGSFKDRQVAIAMSKAREWGRDRFATASSGNVGVALSAYAARAGVDAFTWVSGDAAMSKRQQIQVYGAKLFQLPGLAGGVGPYYQAFLGMGAFCHAHDMVPMISARPVNPYMVEGAKTIAYEIAASLGRAPDLVFSPLGGGGLVGGLYKGFADLRALGLCTTLPALHAVQKGAYFAPVDDLENPRYRSDAYYRPLDGEWAWQSVRTSGGKLRRVEDSHIRAAQALLAQHEGIFAEPQGIYATAGLLMAVDAGEIDKHATTVCVVSGNGLKDMQAAGEMIERFTPRAAQPVASLAESERFFAKPPP